MKRTTCKKCGKERWARTYGVEARGEKSKPVQELCKRCRTEAFGPQEPRQFRQKRIKHKKRGAKPSGKKGKGKSTDDRR